MGTKEKWSEIEEFVNDCSQRALKEETDVCAHLATTMRLHKLTNFDLNELIVDKDEAAKEDFYEGSRDAAAALNPHLNKKFFCFGCRKVSAKSDVGESLKIFDNGNISARFSDSIIRRFAYGASSADSKKREKREIVRTSKESSVSIQTSYPDKLAMLEKISSLLLNEALKSFAPPREGSGDEGSDESTDVGALENCVKIAMCLSTAFFEIAATFVNQLSRVEFDMLCALGSVPFYSPSRFGGCSYAERLKNKASELKSEYHVTKESDFRFPSCRDNKNAGYPEGEYQACKASGIENLAPNYYLSNRDENSKICSIFLDEG
jgi:hypothetical protein